MTAKYNDRRSLSLCNRTHGDLDALWLDARTRQIAVSVHRGAGRFLVFYLECGVAVVLAQALPGPNSKVRMIGASVAISGVHAKCILRRKPRGFWLRNVTHRATVVGNRARVDATELITMRNDCVILAPRSVLRIS